LPNIIQHLEGFSMDSKWFNDEEEDWDSDDEWGEDEE
jgi:hypothetical protein